METLADLDELTLRCRSSSAKAYISEAVAAYRGGAYRSAIVATWIAVMFDFIDKLKELEMSGDANAKQKLTDFEKWRRLGDWKSSLNFETQAIALAQKEFELLSPVEALDLERLREDRNRCAHPSMSSVDEPYSPSAELARTHIRNAVAHLLSHPPVQGKAALERLLKEVESEYFPTDTVKAVEFFKTGPLARAREALVRNFVLALIKTLLRDTSKSAPRKRRFAALNAVKEMYIKQGERTLSDQLPGLISTVPDEKWYRVLFLLANVRGSWEFIGNAAQAKARTYVEQAPEDALWRFLPYALKVDHLRAVAVDRLPNAAVDTLARLVAFDTSPDVVNEAIRRLENASSYRDAEKVFGNVVLPLGIALERPDVERVCKAFVANNQVTYAMRIPRLLLQLLDENPFLPSAKAAWKMVYDRLDGDRDSISQGEALREYLQKQYDF